MTKQTQTPTALTMHNGQLIGRNPNDMSVNELEALGHMKDALTKVIRKKCLDCCSGQVGEVRKCVADSCPLWDYRMGTNPYHKRSQSKPANDNRQFDLEDAIANTHD